MTRPLAYRSFDQYLILGGFGLVVIHEYRFHPDRKWRFDWAFPEKMIAFEYDGLMRRGRNQGHASISGILRDVEKINEAQRLGWRVFRVNAKNICDGSAYRLAKDVLDKSSCPARLIICSE